MYYVYLIQSINFPEIVYIGYTINLDQRLETHNSGGSIHTKIHRPWKLVMHLVFLMKRKLKNLRSILSLNQAEHLLKKDSFKIVQAVA